MELWRRFAEGEVDAFETIFRQSHQDIYRWIVRMVRDPGIAEDPVVETFWRVYRSRATFDWRRSFQAWSRRIATNVTRDYLARGRTEVEWPDALPEPTRPDPLVGRDIQSKVRMALAQLPPKHRIVAMLGLVEGKAHPEIGGPLG